MVVPRCPLWTMMEKNGLEGPMVPLESEAGEGRGAPALEVKIPTCFYLLHFGRYQEVWPSGE